MNKNRFYYYNQYSPNKVMRKWLSRLIFNWADNKYGVKARGNISGKFTEKQLKMSDKWNYCMGVKNYILWNKTFLDKLAEKYLR
jgi:hypothetical protein